MPATQIAILATISASFFAALLVPGPSSLTVMRASLSSGLRPGLATAVGVAGSNAFYAAAAAFGLVAVIEASGTAFTVIKVAGGLYLLHLGLRMLMNRHQPVLQTDQIQEMPFHRAFLRGLLTDLSNPKTIMAFLGIFAIVFPAHPSLTLSMASVAVIGGTSLVWHCILAYLFARPSLCRFYHRAGR